MRRLLVGVALLAAVLGATTASATRLGVTSQSLTTLSASVLQPMGLSLANGGATAGLAEAGDAVRVTFPRALDASTVCPTWTATATTAQSVTANLALTVSIAAVAGGNDRLTVSTTAGACGGTFRFGTVDLGGTGFATASFAGNGNGGRTTATYDPATRVLTVVLGAKAGTTTPVATPTTATYTPDPGLRYVDGSAVTPATGTTTGVQL